MSTATIRDSGAGLVASHVSVTDRAGRVIVDDVSVHARSGRTLVIVGESGAGKSMLARTLCALTPSALSPSGTVSLGGDDYDLAADQARLKKQRGGGIVWLPQDPFTSPAVALSEPSAHARFSRTSASTHVSLARTPTNCRAACASASPLRQHSTRSRAFSSPTNRRRPWMLPRSAAS